MKICVTAKGDNLDAQVDPRFGRCEYFIFVDTDTSEFEAVKNTNIEAMGGAGTQAAQLVASKKVKAVISGSVGPNAFETLSATGIEIIAGFSGTIREAVEKYKSGDLKASQAPTSKGIH